MLKPHVRTTAALVGAAGTFVAVAMLLDRGSAGASSPGRAADPVATTKSAPPTCAHTGGPKATTKLGAATLKAGLSSGAIARGGGGELHAAFEITTTTLASAQRPPVNLAIVIDHSGSMSGRIEHAQAAALGIVQRLDAHDRVSLIEYDDSAEVLVPSIVMDSAGKQRLAKAIHAIALGGGTNLNAGLELGRDEVKRELQASQVSRVILLSDGHANVGVQDTPSIATTARNAANQGVRITAVGVGDDYNEDLMEAIAEAGRGQYHYVKVASDLEKVIDDELSGIQGTVATSVELHLKAPCAGVEIAEVLGYESHRDGDTVVVPMADLSGGDSRKLVVRLHVNDKDLGTIGALWGELVMRDASGGELQRTAVTLGVERTDSQQVALESVDKDVMAQVIQLDAARTMRQAAEAYERGDRDGALQQLEQGRAQAQSKADMYKLAPAAAAPALESMGKMADDTRTYAPGSEESKGMLKASKAKARVMSKK